MLGQGAVGGKLFERNSLLAAKALERRVGCEGRPDRPQRFLFQAEHAVAIQTLLGIERTAGRGQSFQVRPESLGARHVFDVQIQRVAEPTARRVVGAGILRQDGCRSHQRIDQQQSSPQPGRPPGQAPEVVQIADPPTLGRTQTVQLHGPAPLALGRQ